MEYKPVMRTLFSLSIISVVAIGQVLNSGLNKPNEHLTKSLLIHRRKYDNVTATVHKLFSYLVKIQKDLDDQDSKIRFLQNMFANVTATVFELQSYVMNLQSELDDQERKPTSCIDVMKYDVKSGIHTLFLDDNKTLDVYCDQDTDGGGWMMIQRRQDGSVDFYRNWTEYERGFGNLNTEFWIGLANLHHLTKAQKVKLRVDLMGFDGSTAYAVYNTFNISGPEDNYRLNVGGYNGTAGDSLALNKMQFTTYDRDLDIHPTGNCAQLTQGAWWYAQCAYSNLNSRYKVVSAPDVDGDGVTWYYWKSDWRSLKRVEMKIK